MKKLLLFLILLFSIPVFAQAQPALEMLIFPKYIEGGLLGSPRSGIPYVFRARITGLRANTTYRYENKIVNTFTASITTPYYQFILPPGNVNPGTAGYTAGNFYRSPLGATGLKNGSTASGTLTNNYGVLTSDNSGSYTGWFIQETVSSRQEGTTVFIRISLNEPTATNVNSIAYSLTSPVDQPLTVLNMSAIDNDPALPSYGTAIRSTAASSGIPRNFVFLYDNITGNDAGRPIAGTFIEDDGVVGVKAEDGGKNGMATFYTDHVDGVNGTWGAMVLNSDANGLRRIEQRSLADGTIVGYNTSPDGTWANGASAGGTVSTVLTKLGSSYSDGNVALVLDGSQVTLGAVKTDQTVTFTNTFPASFKVGDPDFTLSASSTAGLTGFQYSVAPAGILTITGNTVKIIGGGTAKITVTEPGNATYNADTDTKDIIVDASPQVIAGLPATLAGTYGDPDLELTATGGASASPIVYTSDDVATAEITGGNKIVFKKAGTVTIRANQAGNASYSAAPEVTSSLTIAKASLDVIAEDKVKVQGGANPAATFIYGAFKGSDDANAIAGTPVLTIVADVSSPAGTYDINVDVSGLTSEKYTFNPVKGKLTIEAKLAQTITITNFPAAAIYGNQPLPFQVSSNTANEITFTSSNPKVAVAEKNAIGEWTVKITGAGEANIIASQAEDATYIPGSATQHISVAKAPLSVIADDKSILTGEADPVFTARYTGFVNGDDLSKLSGALAFAKQADGAGFLIIPSGLTSANYALTFVNGKLTQGNTAFASMNKVYGDAAFDPAARSAGATVTYSVANTAVAMVNGAGLLEIKGAGSTQVTANFSTGLSAVATLVVDQKEVTITPDPATRIYAQPNPAFTVSYSGLAYGETETALTARPQPGTTAVLASPVGNYAITASGAAGANYKFIYRTGILSVTRAALIVKADNKSKLYGQVNPELTLSADGLAPQDNLADLNLKSVVTTTAVVASGVNTYPITVNGLASVANYTVTYQPGILSVTPAPLNITAVNADRPQGQPNPVFTFTYTGFVNGDLATGLTSAPVAATTATQASVKGVYPITVSGAASPDYTISYTDGQLSVKGIQTIAYTDLPVLTYGDAAFSPVAASDSGGQPVYSSDNLSVAVIENGRVKIISAGTANITASFAATADFVAATAIKPLVIAKRTLLVRSDSKTKLYGQANPILTATYDGFVNGETMATAVSAPALLTTTATPLSPVGTYTVTGSAGSALNYAFTYEAGILTIDKAILTVTADNKTRAFGLDNPAFTARYTGFVNAENEAVIQNPALASTVAVQSSPAGTYPITLAGATDENYAFNYVSGTLTVTATTRTITMDAIAAKSVGDADFVPNAVLSSGETPVLTSADVSVATIVDNKIHVVGAGNVMITATAPVNTSYSATPSASRLLVVNKVAQTIAFEAVPVLKPDGMAYTLKATSTSGLPVTFTVTDPSHVSLSGDVIRGLRIGKVQISAVQGGNNQYAAAKIVVQDVQVIDADGDGLKVHAALSINGDGVNEFLTIDGIKDFPLNKVTIINRGGLKVFDVEGYDNDTHVFSGKSKSGLVLPQGTYFCLIEYNVDSKLKRKTGYFILKY